MLNIWNVHCGIGWDSIEIPFSIDLCGLLARQCEDRDRPGRILRLRLPASTIEGEQHMSSVAECETHILARIDLDGCPPGERIYAPARRLDISVPGWKINQ